MGDKQKNIKKLETIIGKIEDMRGALPHNMKLQKASRLIRKVIDSIN